MTKEEFIKLIGGKHATVMVCQVDGSTFLGQQYKAGGMTHVDRATGLALYKQMANKEGGGEIHRWVPKDANMTVSEESNLNKHFEKEFERDSGDKPVKVSKHKK